MIKNIIQKMLKRIFNKKVLLIGLSIILFITIFLYVLFYTGFITKPINYITQDLLGLQFSLEEFKVRPFSGMDIKKLSFISPDNTKKIYLERFYVKYDFFKLFALCVHVDEVRIEGIDVKLTIISDTTHSEPEPPKEPTVIPDTFNPIKIATDILSTKVPIDLVVEKVNLKNVRTEIRFPEKGTIIKIHPPDVKTTLYFINNNLEITTNVYYETNDYLVSLADDHYFKFDNLHIKNILNRKNDFLTISTQLSTENIYYQKKEIANIPLRVDNEFRLNLKTGEIDISKIEVDSNFSNVKSALNINVSSITNFDVDLSISQFLFNIKRLEPIINNFVPLKLGGLISIDDLMFNIHKENKESIPALTNKGKIMIRDIYVEFPPVLKIDDISGDILFDQTSIKYMVDIKQIRLQDTKIIIPKIYINGQMDNDVIYEDLIRITNNVLLPSVEVSGYKNLELNIDNKTNILFYLSNPSITLINNLKMLDYNEIEVQIQTLFNDKFFPEKVILDLNKLYVYTFSFEKVIPDIIKLNGKITSKNVRFIVSEFDKKFPAIAMTGKIFSDTITIDINKISIGLTLLTEFLNTDIKVSNRIMYDKFLSKTDVRLGMGDLTKLTVLFQNIVNVKKLKVAKTNVDILFKDFQEISINDMKVILGNFININANTYFNLKKKKLKLNSDIQIIPDNIAKFIYNIKLKGLLFAISGDPLKLKIDTKLDLNKTAGLIELLENLDLKISSNSTDIRFYFLDRPMEFKLHFPENFLFAKSTQKSKNIKCNFNITSVLMNNIYLDNIENKIGVIIKTGRNKINTNLDVDLYHSELKINDKVIVNPNSFSFAANTEFVPKKKIGLNGRLDGFDNNLLNFDIDYIIKKSKLFFDIQSGLNIEKFLTFIPVVKLDTKGDLIGTLKGNIDTAGKFLIDGNMNMKIDYVNIAKVGLLINDIILQTRFKNVSKNNIRIENLFGINKFSLKKKNILKPGCKLKWINHILKDNDSIKYIFDKNSMIEFNMKQNTINSSIAYTKKIKNLVSIFPDTYINIIEFDGNVAINDKSFFNLNDISASDLNTNIDIDFPFIRFQKIKVENKNNVRITEFPHINISQSSSFNFAYDTFTFDNININNNIKVLPDSIVVDSRFDYDDIEADAELKVLLGKPIRIVDKVKVAFNDYKFKYEDVRFNNGLEINGEVRLENKVRVNQIIEFKDLCIGFRDLAEISNINSKIPILFNAVSEDKKYYFKIEKITAVGVDINDIICKAGFFNDVFLVKNLTGQGLSGKFYGDVTVNVFDKPINYYIKSNMTNMNFSQIVHPNSNKDAFLSFAGYIQGQDFRLDKETFDLKMEYNITKIGTKLLDSLLVIVDPEEKNSQIQMLRTMVTVSGFSAKYVELKIESGEFNLYVELLNDKFLPAPPLEIAGIPYKKILISLLKKKSSKK